MQVSLYPGCSLDGVAREYKESLEAVSATMGIELKELQDWICCGASSAHITNDKLAVGLAASNLAIAEKAGRDLVVPCAACYHRLKVAEKHLLQGKPVDGYAGKYTGKIQVKDMVDYVWENVGEKAIKARVKKSLKALNAVCYYGCLVARPPKVTDTKSFENPQEMDKVMKAVGVTVKAWTYKTDCCGGSLVLTRPDIAYKMTQKLLDAAAEAGAEAIVVSCPLCQSNLDVRQAEISAQTGKTYATPIFYFSELLGLAFGDPSATKWVSRHLTDAMPLLRQKGLV